MMTDKMRQAMKLLDEERRRLRLEGSHPAADRLGSAQDYIVDTADELDEDWPTGGPCPEVWGDCSPKVPNVK